MQAVTDPSAIWLEVQEVVELLAISPQAVRENARANQYGSIRYEKTGTIGGLNGHKILIPFSGLPIDAQVRYFRKSQQPNSEGLQTQLTLSEKERQTHELRLHVLQEWRSYLLLHDGEAPELELTAAFIRSWLAHYPDGRLSRASLYRWDRAHREDPVRGLVDGRHDKKSTEIDEDIWKRFLALYCNQSRLSFAEVYRYLISEFGPDLPSLKTFQRRYDHEMTKPLEVFLREGSKAFDDKCQVYAERDYTSLAPMEVISGDHHEFDFSILGPNGTPVRPWLTTWMDVRTRMYVGWCINWDANSDTILMAFRQMAGRYGVPWEVQIDNGKDYRSMAVAGGRPKKSSLKESDKPWLNQREAARFNSLMGQLGVKAHFTIVYNAKAKPIERSFRNVAEQFSKTIETYCGNSVQNKPERLAGIMHKPKNLLTLQELQAIFGQWVEDVYNLHPHRGQGMDGHSPRMVFDELFQTKRTIPEQYFTLFTLRYKQGLRVQRNGVRLFEHWYRSEKLLDFLAKDVTVRYDQDDMGKVYVFDADGRFICEAECRELLSWHATSEELREVQREKAAHLRKQKEFKRMLDEHSKQPDRTRAVITRMRLNKAGKPTGPKPTPKVVVPVRNRMLEEASQAIAVGQNLQQRVTTLGVIDTQALLQQPGRQPRSHEEVQRIQRENCEILSNMLKKD